MPLLLCLALAACDEGPRVDLPKPPDVGPRDTGEGREDGEPDTEADASEPDSEPDPEVAAGRARLFGAETVVPVAIELSPDSLARLKADPRSDYVPAALTIDGRRFPRVGLRLKGNASFRPITGKASFKIDLTRYDDDASLHGLRKLTLNNMLQDPTKLRERLAATAFALLEVPAPAVGYVEVTVNDELYGLYSHVESVDEAFLRRVLPGDDGGVLYEGTFDLDLWGRDVGDFDKDAGKDGGRDRLRRLVAALDRATPATFDAVVGAVVDLERMRRFFAAELVVGHWDGYAKTRNNYYLYRRPADGRWLFFPWGTDQTFSRTRSALEGSGRLFRMCVDWLPCRLPYAEMVRTLADRLEAYDWDAEIDRLLALTGEAFERDPKKRHNAEQRAAGVEALRTFLDAHPQRMRDSLTCMDPARDADGDLTLACGGDCNDADPTIYPGALDTCDDEIDQDCSGFTDDGWLCPPCRRARAPDGAVFLLCHRPEAYNGPQDTCHAQDAELASVRDADEQAFLAEAALARRRTRWLIGLRDTAEEGTFAWLDGAPLTYTHWATGQPDDRGGEDCVVLTTSEGGAWADVHCGLYMPFVCRLP